MSPRQRIAVIGSGIAGLATAWLLSKRYDVVLFEKEGRLGGHSNTVEVDYDGVKIPVDTGFIVFNHQTYPHLKAMFEHLAIPTKKSNMSFGASIKRKIEYASHNMGSVFANPLMALSPSYWQMLSDILKFNRKAPELLVQQTDMTLGEYLDRLGMKQWFRDYYILPMAAAIWSSPGETMLKYPASTFIRFFHNHGLLTVNKQPQWYTVDGGSREYIKRLRVPFADHIRLSSPVKNVWREGEKISVILESGDVHLFDQAVIAAHGDQALAMLGNATEAEQKTLSAFTYQKNRAVLHRDTSIMPKRKAAWASWVCSQNETGGPMSVTYWMNRLQGIDAKKPLFVTLNPVTEPAKDKVFAEFMYDHPIFDQAAIDAQAQLPALQGAARVWFAGSYHRYGFHEDALMSAVEVANCLGVRAPWH